jgi:phage gp29-like protein
MAANTISMPEKRELITNLVLRWVGLNAQAFSGAQNPANIYRTLVDGGAAVFQYLREIEEKDTAIGSALETRRMLVLAREAKVTAADAESGAARQYSDALSAMLDGIAGWYWHLWELLDAPAYGYTVSEIIWRPEGAGVGVSELKGRPQEIFRFGQLTEPQNGALLYSPSGTGANLTPAPEAKFIVNTFRPRHGDRRGLPLLRRLFWASWFKRNALRLHLKFLEKGRGTVVTKYPTGAEDAVKAEALEASQAIAEEISAAVPESFNLVTEALQGTRTHNGADFSSLFDYLDAEMRRVVLQQTQTTQGGEQGRGALAQAVVHADLQNEMVRADAIALEEAINEQLCRPWLRWTFGEQALDRAVRPWWRIDKNPPKDVNRLLDQIGKARAVGMKVPEDWAHEQTQIPQAEGGAAVLPPAALSVGMLGGFEPEETQ